MRLTTELRVEGFEGRGGGPDVEVAGVVDAVGFEKGMDALAGEGARAAELGFSDLDTLRTAEGILKSALCVDLPVGVPRSQGFGGEGDAMVIVLLSRPLPPLYPIRSFPLLQLRASSHAIFRWTCNVSNVPAMASEKN